MRLFIVQKTRIHDPYFTLLQSFCLISWTVGLYVIFVKIYQKESNDGYNTPNTPKPTSVF